MKKTESESKLDEQIESETSDSCTKINNSIEMSCEEKMSEKVEIKHEDNTRSKVNAFHSAQTQTESDCECGRIERGQGGNCDSIKQVSDKTVSEEIEIEYEETISDRSDAPNVTGRKSQSCSPCSVGMKSVVGD